MTLAALCVPLRGPFFKTYGLMFVIQSLLALCRMLQHFSWCWTCPTLCDPADCSPPGSVHRILQAECRSGLPFPPPGDLPHPGTKPRSAASPESAGRSFTTAPPGKSSRCRHTRRSQLFLATPRFTQGCSSLTGDPASVPCSGSRVLASGPLEKSLSTLLDA